MSAIPPAAAGAAAITHDAAITADATSDAGGTDRRDFLQRLMGAGALVAGAGLLTGCATGAAAAPTPAGNGGSAPPPVAPSAEWDMSWVQKLGRYKTAYDSPEIYGGAALHYANAAADGYRMAYGAPAGQFTPVLILRHTATVMTLDDAMWARIGIGEQVKVNDPRTGAPAVRNPFIGWQEGDQRSMVGRLGGVDSHLARGSIVMCCNNALMGVAYMLRQKEKELTPEQARAEVRKAVIPGVYVMPNGHFACAAVQDAGCNYVRVVA